MKKFNYLKRFFLIFSITLASQFMANAQLCGNYTIDGTIVTGGTNFQSFSDAANELNTNGISCSVVFNIAPGTYTENVNLGAIAGSSSVNTISFLGSGAATTTLIHDGTVSEATWQLVGTSYITIKNLTVQNTKATTDAWGIHMSGAADNVIIDSCTVVMPTGNTADVGCIVASSSLTALSGQGNNVNHLQITNCRIEGSFQGIRLNGTNSATGDIEDIYVANNVCRYQYAASFQILDVKELVIEFNDIDSIITGGTDYGMSLSRINDYRISGNTVRRSSGTGIRINVGNSGFVTTQNSEVSNNFIVNTGGVCLNPVSYQNTNIYNNTLIAGGAAILSNTHTNVDIRNNIFYSTAAYAFRSQVAFTASDIVDNNLYYSPSALLYRVVADEYADLASWQAASPALNVNSIESVPSFLAADDFHLYNDFNAYNNGVDVGVTTDLDGEVRPQDGGFDIGADEFSLVLAGLDLAVIDLLEPSAPFCSGSQDIWVVVENQGVDLIDSINLTLAITGSPNTIFNIGSLNIPSLETDTINLGSFTFNVGVNYDITVSSLDPNGALDTVTSNDTLLVAGLSPSLSGTFTIDAATATGGTNFQSFHDATTALNTLGICGPTVFNVAAGTYTDSVYLGSIVGSSPSNFITFNGAGSLVTTLTYDGSNTQATWQMVGTSYITIKNLTIETTKSTFDGWCVHLSGSVNTLFVDSCRFLTPITTSADIFGLVASNSLTSEISVGENADNVTVSNSYFVGGEGGIHIEGSNAISTGFNFTNNEFYEHEDEAIEMDNVENVVISNNYILYSGTSTGADGIVCLDINNFQIDGNVINTPDYGIYLNDANDGFATTVNSVIANNMVISTGAVGLELLDFSFVSVYHNTVQGTVRAFEMTFGDNLDVRNNIFQGLSGAYAIQSTSLTGSAIIDYNLYYSTGSPFDIDGTIYPDLASWQAAAPLDNLNSIEAEPSFVSATDLHMNDDLNAYNNGVDVGTFGDIDQQLRPLDGGYDIGADEFSLNINLGVTALIDPSSSIACENEQTYFTFVVTNAGQMSQDTIPYSFNLDGTSVVSFLDTSFVTIPAGSTDTITVGPINTVGMGASILTINTTILGDLVTDNDTLITNITFNANSFTVDLGSDVSYCSNETLSLTLDAGSASTYEWSTTETTQTINVTTQGVYSVTAIDASGCSASDTITIVENAAPLVDAGTDTTWCPGDVIPLPADNGNGVAYVWTDNGNNVVTEVTSEGTFIVSATGTNGCISTDTLVIGGCTNGLFENDGTLSVTVYPNPASDVVNIKLDESISNIQVEFIALSGQLVHSTVQSVNGVVEIDLSNLNEGVYLLKVTADSGVYVDRFIKE